MYHHTKRIAAATTERRLMTCKKLVAGLVIVACFGMFVSRINAAHIILETSAPGLTNGGNPLMSARFLITERTEITKIGGHVKGRSGKDRSIFAAVVPLMDTDPFEDALPEADALDSPLFSTTFIAPFNDNPPYPYQVPTTLIETSFVLEPGGYGLVFGSGLFGATGYAWMPVRGSIADRPWLFNRNSSGDWEDFDREQAMRFVVQGEQAPVPAPSSLSCMAGLFAMAFVASWWRRRKRT